MKKIHEKIYSIGEAARKCGVSIKQIRHWEDKGYIPEPDRVVCGERAYRKFGPEEMKIIKKIKAGLDAGFTLQAAAKRAAGGVSDE